VGRKPYFSPLKLGLVLINNNTGRVYRLAALILTEPQNLYKEHEVIFTSDTFHGSVIVYTVVYLSVCWKDKSKSYV